MILGSGPNRIGQGIEFDYCCVHAAQTVRELGRDAVMINCNPETVSTDYDTSDRLYFEPLTLEDVLGVCEIEQPEGVVVQFGGQTPLKLAAGLHEAGRADPRHRASRRSTSPRTARGSARCSTGSATRRRRTRRAQLRGRGARDRPEVGFPLLVRPSYVLGGRAMEIVYSVAGLKDYLDRVGTEPGTRRSTSTASSRTRSRSTSTRCATAPTSGSPAIMQHVEEAGIHSGDSACVLPPHALGEEMLALIAEQTAGIARGARRRRTAQRPVRDPATSRACT